MLDSELPGLLGQAEWYTQDCPAAILEGKDSPRRPSPLRRWRREGRVRRAIGSFQRLWGGA